MPFPQFLSKETGGQQTIEEVERNNKKDIFTMKMSFFYI